MTTAEVLLIVVLIFLVQTLVLVFMNHQRSSMITNTGLSSGRSHEKLEGRFALMTPAEADTKSQEKLEGRGISLEISADLADAIRAGGATPVRAISLDF